MKMYVFQNKKEVGAAAAKKASKILKESIVKNGNANFIAATGAAQIEFLKSLVKDSSIDWNKTMMFHLDEYINLPKNHPASFRRYLKKRFIDKVHPGIVHLINGNARNPEVERERLKRIISSKKIDIAFVGIGENGHLAFNEPPADF